MQRQPQQDSRFVEPEPLSFSWSLIINLGFAAIVGMIVGGATFNVMSPDLSLADHWSISVLFGAVVGSAVFLFVLLSDAVDAELDKRKLIE